MVKVKIKKGRSGYNLFYIIKGRNKTQAITSNFSTLKNAKAEAKRLRKSKR